MKTFSDKIKQARTDLGLNQQQLADAVGISKRSVAAYETTDTKPRGAVVKKLAQVLRVSVDYLLLDEVDDPGYGIGTDLYVNLARERFGSRGAQEMEELLNRNRALFAGGVLEQEDKDAFFEAVMKAYLICKEEARHTYGRKDTK